ncbi:O-antigen ligase family protein [Brevundimonas nasdae]|uniref:O-antigen ligase family protein n=2 Tax=Brevundimonas nasdae TaxID=172043 RepID=A0ABX8TEA8_9CAUL|nr:O-antigen ligase family protein [Brevundimonas nasdae]QYC08979.1 O-antigen ligase family protein [Brevundimonas nasdae]QYC15029.1 O-antigen ligase family protein [Brevundimonas nasdae]
MSETSHRRRRRSTAFAGPSSKGGPERVDWRSRIMLGVVPALLFAAHLTFGANHVAAAQWLSVVLGLLLVAALAAPPARIGLFDLKPVWPLAVLFLITLGVAAWSLTPFTPGGPHPIWTWADMAGSSTVNRSATILEMTKLVGLGCVFVLGCLQGARSDRARATVDVLLALGAVYAAIALLSFLSGGQIMAGGRLSGGFLSANSGASVFGILTVIGLANLLRRWRQAKGADVMKQLGEVAVPLAFVLLFVTCLVLTASRMGVAATVVAAGVLLLWDMIENKGRRLPVLISGAVLLVVGAVLLLGGNDLLWSRFDALDRDTLVRTSIFTAHWQAFLDSPLFGYGLGTFNDVNSQIMTAENYKDLWLIRATHNLYIQWLEEAGIVGATPMVLLIGVIIAVGVWRTGKVRKGQTTARGLVAASLVVLIHGTTDYALQTPSIAAFWAFLLGLQFAFGQSRA